MLEALDFAEYRNFWIVAEDEASQVFPHAEFKAAIAEYQFRLKQGESPRFLGEKEDASLHDLTASVSALSPNQDR
jgi:hypothetical protein